MYGEATIDDRSIDVAIAYPNALFDDAHNILVEFSVTVGSLGLIAFLVWICLAGRLGGGELALFALVVGLAHLFQPQHIPTALPALLALGASIPIRPEKKGLRSQRFLPVGLGAIGLLAAVGVLVGAFNLNQARLDFDLRAVKVSQRLLGAWAEPYSRQAIIHQFYFATGDRSSAASARAALRGAIRREPRNFEMRYRLGDIAQSHGLFQLARAAYAESLKLNPYATNAMLGLVRLELAEHHDVAAARRWLAQAVKINPALADRYGLSKAQLPSNPQG